MTRRVIKDRERIRKEIYLFLEDGGHDSIIREKCFSIFNLVREKKDKRFLMCRVKKEKALPQPCRILRYYPWQCRGNAYDVAIVFRRSKKINGCFGRFLFVVPEKPNSCPKERQSVIDSALYSMGARTKRKSHYFCTIRLPRGV